MQQRTFIKRLAQLTEEQGGEEFAALALSELGIEYADEVPNNLYEFVLARVRALYEEKVL